MEPLHTFPFNNHVSDVNAYFIFTYSSGNNKQQRLCHGSTNSPRRLKAHTLMKTGLALKCTLSLLTGTVLPTLISSPSHYARHKKTLLSSAIRTLASHSVWASFTAFYARTEKKNVLASESSSCFSQCHIASKQYRLLSRSACNKSRVV